MSSYTAITEDGKYLIHYGVKGMKWRKKKKRVSRSVEYKKGGKEKDYTVNKGYYTTGFGIKPIIRTETKDRKHSEIYQYFPKTPSGIGALRTRDKNTSSSTNTRSGKKSLKSSSNSTNRKNRKKKTSKMR